MAYRNRHKWKKLTPYRVLFIDPGTEPLIVEQGWTEKRIAAMLAGSSKRVPARAELGLWLDEGWIRTSEGGERNLVAENLLELDPGEKVFGRCLLSGYDPQLGELLSVSMRAVSYAMRAHKRLKERA